MQHKRQIPQSKWNTTLTHPWRILFPNKFSKKFLNGFSVQGDPKLIDLMAPYKSETYSMKGL